MREPVAACDACLARSWLLGRLAGHLDNVRARIPEVLSLREEELISAVAGRTEREVRGELAAFDPDAARRRACERGLSPICRCDASYPARLRSLEAPPAVLHVAGRLDRFLELAGGDPVALIGARRASPYGLEVARSLARDLAGAGIAIVSGMALGVDSAAHAGALGAAAATIAVLPGAADRPYPPAKAPLYRQIRASGAAVSELAPGTRPRRWMFPSRNRIIAGISAMTIVVEAAERSGALLTARTAEQLGRPVGAVPGRITSPTATGSNELIKRGACLITSAQDVLDRLFGAGVREARRRSSRGELAPRLQALLEAIAAGHDTLVAFAQVGLSPAQGLAGLAELELGGYVNREPGGRFTPSA